MLEFSVRRSVAIQAVSESKDDPFDDALLDAELHKERPFGMKRREFALLSATGLSLAVFQAPSLASATKSPKDATNDDGDYKLGQRTTVLEL